MKLERAFIYPVKSLRGVEVASLELDDLGPASFLHDFPFENVEPLSPPRRQNDRRPVCRQHLGKTRAKPGRCPSNKGYFSGQIKKLASRLNLAHERPLQRKVAWIYSTF